MRNLPSQRVMIICLTIIHRIVIWKYWFLRRGENRSTRRKTSRSKDENQQQTQPTYDVESGNRTRGGECPRHCAFHDPLNIYRCTRVRINRAFSHDVTVAIWVYQNNETAAMLVYQTNPVGVGLFSYVKTLFCSNKFAWLLAT